MNKLVTILKCNMHIYTYIPPFSFKWFCVYKLA